MAKFIMFVFISLLASACDITVESQPGLAGEQGEDGTSCIVIDNGDDTATMLCPDGSSVTWTIDVPPVQNQSCNPVTFKDPILKKCVFDMYDSDWNGLIDESEAQEVTDIVCDGISDLSGLRCFPNISIIRSHTGEVTELTELIHLHSLEILFMDGQKIQNLKPLAGLSKLGQLSLVSNPIHDLSPLRTLTHLQWVNLAGTNIGSLNGLPSSITLLNLSYTDVEDLTPLKNLKNLEVLYATGCLIADPTPLLSLKILHFLNLAENPIDCEKYSGTIEQLHDAIADSYNDLDVVCPPQ